MVVYDAHRRQLRRRAAVGSPRASGSKALESRSRKVARFATIRAMTWQGFRMEKLPVSHVVMYNLHPPRVTARVTG